MHTLRTSTSLLLLPLLLCLAGCASTSGVSSKMQTVASVGDKKYPVVTGEPGASVVADAAPAEPSVRAKGRISGRVVDDTGEPLPDVRVRLAVGNTPGGQVISATTDRTGAFTLNGVRAGSSHTVIAEWEDGQEYLTGRSVVDAPDTNVRITLAPSGTESKTASAPIRPNRISPVSEKASLPDPDDDDETLIDVPRVSSRKPRVNVEDLPPPEAESYPAAGGVRTPAPARQGSATGRVRWRGVGADGVTRQDSKAATEPGHGKISALQDSETHEASAIASSPADEDEGPNPLPPALEPGQAPRDRDLVPLPRARKPRSVPRSAAISGDDDDALAREREPGQMSVTAPARTTKPRRSVQTHEVEPESDSEPASSEVNPLPPAREPGREGDLSLADPSLLPAPGLDPESEPELGPEKKTSASSSADIAFLPPAVEAGQAEKPAEVPGPIGEAPAAGANLLALSETTPRFLSDDSPAAPVEAAPATSADLAALSETKPPFLNDLPGPVEAASAEGQPAPGLPPAVAAAPGRNEVAEPSPFDTPSFEPASSFAPAMAAATGQSVFETGSDAPATNEAPAPPPDTRKRPTWKDLASLAPKPPLAQVESRKGVGPAVLGPMKPAAHAFLMEQPPALPTSTRAAPSQAQADVGKAFCDYDAKHRKINDFRLPDLEGRPVRFQELDADLVLIDFWGTWCQPCLRSIPHLVELQNRMGTGKLKVVGIACEQGPLAERAKTVSLEVRRLGINYPVLLSGMDGPCPLQEALKVQAYPTLILVDRQGRIVWQDQGATPVTLGRLDRFLASTSKSEQTRRY
ncbi:Thiol-disulfide isomerase or thioredoxin [Singulisphaera sp. GP187]|uniref:redoxin family protein n=1 Tax=Singulisphaera sp. GP187 TaxID=1882752 RepID=UPI00092C0B6D|nr:redoxin family protein [Singulisphaera sp. GP187]SIN79677.1 Thiol-disulfide isomerase or thioredoxin [Singulisphaera sp. GP187]